MRFRGPAPLITHPSSLIPRYSPQSSSSSGARSSSSGSVLTTSSSALHSGHWTISPFSTLSRESSASHSGQVAVITVAMGSSCCFRVAPREWRGRGKIGAIGSAGRRRAVASILLLRREQVAGDLLDVGALLVERGAFMCDAGAQVVEAEVAAGAEVGARAQ